VHPEGKVAAIRTVLESLAVKRRRIPIEDVVIAVSQRYFPCNVRELAAKVQRNEKKLSAELVRDPKRRLLFVEYFGPLKERPRKSGRKRSQETKEKIADSMLEVWKKKRATSGHSNSYADLETPVEDVKLVQSPDIRRRSARRN